jgi:SLT domain-containing protein
LGYRGPALERRVRLNARQVNRESMRRPGILQGFIGDVNDHRPAGGLMQFVAPTFRHWRVGSRRDRFNPLDSLLAAVNAQVHGPYKILDGTSGWSPPLARNPLATGAGFAVTV